MGASMNLALPLAGLILLIADAAPGGCGGGHHTPAPDWETETCDDTASVCVVTTDAGCTVEQASCSGGVFVCPEGAKQVTPETADATCPEPDAG